MNAPSLTLPIDGPYDLHETLKTLTMGAGNPCLRHNRSAAELTLATPDGPVAVRAERGESSLRVAVSGEGADWLEPHLPRLFGLTDDRFGFQPVGKLGRLAKQHAGHRLPVVPIIFHRLVQVLLQQLITFRDACRGWRLLVQKYGEPAPGLDGLFFPPSAERLANTVVSQFIECDILPRHARLILEVARKAAGLERLWAAGAEPGAADRLSDFLLRQRGIGPWSVGYLRGAGLGDADAVVLGDYGHPHHVAYFFTGKERSNDEEMLKLLAPYRPHRFRVLMTLILGAPTPPRRGPKRAPLRLRLR